MIGALRSALTRARNLMRPVDEASAPPPSPAAAPARDLSAYATYFGKARAAGLSGPTLFLSFDCDTDWDIQRVGGVHDMLADLGIKATYAVPGAQLLKGAREYRALADRGAEFMNHGQAPHAEWREDRYVSVTWYHEMTPQEVEADMRAAHATIEGIIGQTPRGFRAPHFGLFKEPDQLALVRGVSRALGYSYCSTTVPQEGLDHGPAYDADGIVELPTLGSVYSPTCLLDTWTYLTDRKQYALGEEYADLFIETVDTFLDEGLPALLTWYGDPSHVAGQRPFARAMEHIAKRGVPSLYGHEAAALGKA